jgi:hypothetical protein
MLMPPSGGTFPARCRVSMVPPAFPPKVAGVSPALWLEKSSLPARQRRTHENRGARQAGALGT